MPRARQHRGNCPLTVCRFSPVTLSRSRGRPLIWGGGVAGPPQRARLSLSAPYSAQLVIRAPHSADPALRLGPSPYYSGPRSSRAAPCAQRWGRGPSPRVIGSAACPVLPTRPSPYSDFQPKVPPPTKAFLRDTNLPPHSRATRSRGVRRGDAGGALDVRRGGGR